MHREACPLQIWSSEILFQPTFFFSQVCTTSLHTLDELHTHMHGTSTEIEGLWCSIWISISRFSTHGTSIFNDTLDSVKSHPQVAVNVFTTKTIYAPNFLPWSKYTCSPDRQGHPQGIWPRLQLGCIIQVIIYQVQHNGSMTDGYEPLWKEALSYVPVFDSKGS